MKTSTISTVLLGLVSLSLPACKKSEAEPHHEQQKIVVTSPKQKDVVLTQQYVCLIHSQRYTKISAIMSGYLEEIPIKEGQAVKKGETLFTVNPILYTAKRNTEAAEAQVMKLKFEQTKKLFNQQVVSDQDVLLHQADFAKAQAKLSLAEAELNFASIKAPFDGIVDRLMEMQGSLVKEGDVLTTLSDNSVMWVYFNVPEKRYLEFKALKGGTGQTSKLELVDSRIELQLADGSKFDQETSNVVTVEAKFNNETGNIAFRSDFPNPKGLLRYGQTGMILIHRTHHNAVVIPQRATYEILDKRYAYVVGDDDVVHQRPIVVGDEIEDAFVIKSGLSPKDKIVLEGVREVRDGKKIEYEFMKPEDALSHQKFHAE